MKGSLSVLLVGLLGLRVVSGAVAQVPRSVIQPGSPEMPEMQGLRPFPPAPSQPAPSEERSPALAPASATGPPPVYTLNIGPRSACITPTIKRVAKADGGSIDVALPAPNTISVVLTGLTAANSHLGCTSSASQCFRLIQEFEITCSDPKVTSVVLALDSVLAGYVRSKHKAGACVRLANASVRPASWDSTPLVIAHPPLCVSGTAAQLYNQHLPVVQGPPMPLGKYVLVANFVIDCTGGGLCDGHAVADFSPDAALPADWIRMRDPFQGAAKKSFGFSLLITAAPPSEPAGVGRAPRDRPVVHRAGRRVPEVQQASWPPLPFLGPHAISLAPNRVGR
jgi:hypothetical protein